MRFGLLLVAMAKPDTETLRAEFPLPDGVPDAELNKTECAEFMGVSLPTVEAWIRAGMPVIEEGTNGKAWRIQASEVWAWREAQRRAELTRRSEAQAAIEAMRLKLIGGKSGDTMRGLPPKERQAIYAAEATHEQLKRERNITLLRQDVEDAFADMLSLVRDSVTAFPDRLEREASLNAAQVNVAISLGDELLEELAKRMQEFFAARPIKESEQDRDDMFGDFDA